ncbi:unnamed protein product [Porites lobata]|uniref:Ankyrin repeat domain-containing protein 10 n=1 Tax=Porites lobata TaxID=104759 RepID=A0ABN8N2L9_9CNID|nr:unnamed protein product [Porites lobata]
MGSECGFQTKQQLNECILRCAWSEHPLPPVPRACRDGDMLSLTYLTVQGDRLAVFRSLNEQDHYLKWTPAHWAAYFGKVDCLKRLVDCGLNIDVCEGRFEQTPAHLAAFAGHANVLHWLLQNGAVAEKVDSFGETTVHKAARGGNVECLRLLQAFVTTFSTFNMYRQTPCDLASSLGFEQCAQLLRSQSHESGMVQYLDHVEIHSSSAISHDFYITNGTSQQASRAEDTLYQNGHVHNCTRNNSSSTQKIHDVEMNCDEVEESANKTYPGNHYLNQPVRCLNLCGHLQ